MERENTAELVRRSDKGLIPYTTWSGAFIALMAVPTVLMVAGILGLFWFIPTTVVALIWVTATAHGFRHGWLK